MKAFFSKRHQEAIFEKKINLSFSTKCRMSILRILEKYSDWGGYDNADNDTFFSLAEDLKTFYGESELRAFNKDNKYVAASVEEVIHGDFPAHMLDVVEAWFYQNPKRLRECEKELNDILTIHDSPWRIVNGDAILIDSEYLHQEVRAKTINLLKEQNAIGALEEYQQAINDLVSGETKDAVVKAHKSVESVMKCALEIEGNYPFGQLLTMLVKSTIIPEYYKSFLKHFEQLALGAVKERNLPGRGHGQGIVTTSVSPSLAEFTVNLAGSINLFIVKHWIETKQPSDDEDTILSANDLPF